MSSTMSSTAMVLAMAVTSAVSLADPQPEAAQRLYDADQSCTLDAALGIEWLCNAAKASFQSEPPSPSDNTYIRSMPFLWTVGYLGAVRRCFA